MATLRRIRVAPRDVAVPPTATALPRPEQAEPYEPAPDHGAPTVAHGPTFAARAVAWVDRLRGDNAERAEAAIRAVWAAGYRGGRLALRVELQARLRSDLEAGRYDYRTGNAAARDILAHLDQETQ